MHHSARREEERDEKEGRDRVERDTDMEERRLEEKAGNRWEAKACRQEKVRCSKEGPLGEVCRRAEP